MHAHQTTAEGRATLSAEFRTCTALASADEAAQLIQWVQAPTGYMAMGK